MTQSEALKPVVVEVELTDANTEYEAELPTNVKHFSIQAIGSNPIRFALEEGKVASSVAPFMTLKADDSYTSPEKVSWSKAN